MPDGSPRISQFLSTAFDAPYIFLLAAVLVLVFGYALIICTTEASFSPARWFQGLIIGVFSAYLAAVLVTGYYQTQEQKERQQMRHLAASELQSPLTEHLDLLASWYTVAALEGEYDSTKSLKDVFDDDFAAVTKHLDFAAEIPEEMTTNAESWLQYSADHLEMFTSDLDNIVQKYEASLNPDTVRAITSLRDSNLIQTIRQNADIVNDDPPSPADYFNSNGNENRLAPDHIEAVEEVAQFVQKETDEPLRHLNDAMSSHLHPPIQSARCSLD